MPESEKNQSKQPLANTVWQVSDSPSDSGVCGPRLKRFTRRNFESPTRGCGGSPLGSQHFVEFLVDVPAGFDRMVINGDVRFLL
jgi:hypothetical protein